LPARYAAVAGLELRRDHHCLLSRSHVEQRTTAGGFDAGPFNHWVLGLVETGCSGYVIASPPQPTLETIYLCWSWQLTFQFSTESSGSGDPNAKSRRRRRGADPESQPKTQSFYFVDSTSSSKEKRAHVMRHHVQEKRKHRKLSHGSLQPEQMPEPTVWPVRIDSGYDTDTPKDAAALAGVPGPAVEQESSV
jgi:hypothetical protein